MSITIPRLARRRLLELAAASPLALTTLRSAAAQRVLDPDGAQAQALGYHEDATSVDQARWSKYADGNTCATCRHYRGEDGAERGACPIFGNQLVAARGWCSAWIPAG